MPTPSQIAKQALNAVDHIANDTETPLVIRCDILEELAVQISRHLDQLCRLRPSCQPMPGR